MDGPTFYDNGDVFDTYLSRRGRPDSPNDTLEKPILLELIGEVRGLRLLDLGCGDAAIALELLQAGAQSYLGIDGSANMVALARQTLAGSPARVEHTDLQTWDPPPLTFDLAISRLALHYLPDLEPVLCSIHTALKPGGCLVFSVEHPVITSSDRGWQTGLRQDWLVDDYFVTGPRTTEWMGGHVVKYHRTLEHYFTAVQSAGFIVERLRESRPQREHFADDETYRRRMRIPLFLFVAGRKDG